MKLLRRTATLNPKDKKQPRHETAYLAGPVGSFYLHGHTGHAHYVWFHPNGSVDFHLGELKYAGSTRLADGTEFYVYTVADHTHHDPADPDQHRPPHTRGTHHAHGDDVERIYFAKTRADEEAGHRVLYESHEQLHLWTWEAVQFRGHH